MDYDTTNFAYIDGANLHSALRSVNWRLDYKRFRTWLCGKYNVGQAYVFIGYIKSNTGLITYLNEHRALLEEINKKAPDADRTAEGSLS